MIALWISSLFAALAVGFLAGFLTGQWRAFRDRGRP